ncbi:putative sugar kinase [Archaeoglobus sulfaticallidus PM70-1]|uniref:NAD kinase n=1 Tax=Archaeoglobus sulfaticallidus PM70-1 TaxID=387631 RepID=N0BIQ1_9EURY|nr:NAD(+)/NADH kinase [Archaeoglobus sulfaticallidus]AGK60351.1 putative sugar kinase [Archaeoglobus sulfaticallidus PM70-1]
MKVAIVYKYGSIGLAREVASFLEDNGVYTDLYHLPVRDLSDYDFIISIGGDGTILQILQSLENPPPIFGINKGRIGILTHAEPDNFRDGLRRILDGDMKVESFMRLDCIINSERTHTALNEIAVLSSEPARLIGMRVLVDGVEIEDLRADGMLFSTPIGSTAYALSTGGPIVDPYLFSILITPIAPFKLGWKPWIVKRDSRISVELYPDRNSLIIADGQKRVEVSPDAKIEIVESEHPARFFEIKNRLKRIAEKLKYIR